VGILLSADFLSLGSMILGSGVGHLPPIGGGGGLDGEVTLLAQAGGPTLGSGGEHAWGGGRSLGVFRSLERI
jgi:hypothetical protein